MGKTKRRHNYDWAKLLAVGSSHTLRYGKDYACTERTLINYIYHQAKAAGVRAQVTQPKAGVIVITAHNGELDGRRT